MRGVIVAALLAAVFPAVQAHAQTVPVVQTPPPVPVAENFLTALKRNDIEGGLKELGTASPMLASRLGDETPIRGQIRTALAAYGPILGWERIESKTLGTMARRDTYLVQHRDMVTRWRFVFIHTATGWIMGSFNFDDQGPTWFDPPASAPN